MLFDHLVGDVKSQSESAVVAADTGSLEAPKDSRQFLLRNTDAAILHDQCCSAVLHLQVNVDRFSGAKFYRVRDDVADGFLEPKLVDSGADATGSVHSKFALRVRCDLRKPLHDFLDHLT